LSGIDLRSRPATFFTMLGPSGRAKRRTTCGMNRRLRGPQRRQRSIGGRGHERGAPVRTARSKQVFQDTHVPQNERSARERNKRRLRAARSRRSPKDGGAGADPTSRRGALEMVPPAQRALGARPAQPGGRALPGGQRPGGVALGRGAIVTTGRGCCCSTSRACRQLDLEAARARCRFELAVKADPGDVGNPLSSTYTHDQDEGD